MAKFTYKKEKLENTQKNVKSVTFGVSRYGKYICTLSFDDFLTEAEAVKKVEEYLSNPLTESYYNDVKDDLFFDSYDNYKSGDACYGTLLGDARFLEGLRRKDDKIFIVTGS